MTAISIANLDSKSGAGTASFVSNSRTPSADKRQFLCIQNTSDGGVVTGVTGCGLTWTEVQSQTIVGFSGATVRHSIWTALGASPTTGAVTITWTNAQSVVGLIWDEVSPADAAGSVVQSNKSTGASNSDLATTLAAFADAVNNAAYASGLSAGNGASTFTPGAGGWAELADIQPNARHGMCSEWLLGEDTTPTATSSLAQNWSMIALEASASDVPPPAPEMNVQGNLVSIADDDNTPDAADHTAFADTIVGQTSDRVYTIQNTGDANLTLTDSPAVTIGGTHAAQFALQAAPTTPVVPAGSTTFTIRFTPTSSGAKVATLSIANNDTSENPYNWSIGGTGIAATKILTVHDGVTQLTDGQINAVDFGEAFVSDPEPNKVFTLTNTGNTLLTLSNITVPIGYEAVDPAPDLTLNPDQEVELSVNLLTVEAGTKSGSISIDTDGSPATFNFPVTGVVVSLVPELAVELDAVDIPDGSATPIAFPATPQGQTPPTKTFTVRNTGAGMLSITAYAVPAGYTIMSDPGPTIAPAGSEDLVVQMDTDTPGTPAGNVEITCDDPDEGTFTFAISGTVRAAGRGPWWFIAAPNLFLDEKEDELLPGVVIAINR